MSLTFSGEISLFLSHKKNRNSIHKKRFGFQVLWRPGSARTRWRSLQHSRKPPSWILRGPTFKSREGREIKREMKERGEKRGGDEGGEEGEREGMGACTHWNFRKSAPMPADNEFIIIQAENDDEIIEI